MLLFAARRLLVELCGYLAATASGVQRLAFTFSHHGREPTRLTLSLVAATRDADHLTSVLRERLERTALPCPATAIALESELLLPLASRNLSLLPDAGQQEEAAAQLIERLRARLGEEAVLGLKRFPDHRPEYAWRTCEPGSKDAAAARAIAGRPLWLLNKPRAAFRSRRRAVLRRAPDACSPVPSASNRAGGTATTSRAIISSRAIRLKRCCGFIASASTRRQVVSARVFCLAESLISTEGTGGYGGKFRFPCSSPLSRVRMPFPPTPSCTASPTSRSCAAPRIPKSSSSARTRSATARSRSPTSARSPASCARISQREAMGFKLIIGTEVKLEDGPKLVLLATEPRKLWRMCALITRGRMRTPKGRYRLERRDFDDGLAGCLALLVPDGVSDLEHARFVAERFPGARGLQSSSCRGRTMRRGSPRCARSEAKRPAARRRRATCTCTCARAGRCRT